MVKQVKLIQKDGWSSAHSDLDCLDHGTYDEV